MAQPALFPDPLQPISDTELAAVLREAVASGRRLPRHADTYLAGVCAEYLVDYLHLAGLDVVRAVRPSGA